MEIDDAVAKSALPPTQSGPPPPTPAAPTPARSRLVGRKHSRGGTPKPFPGTSAAGAETTAPSRDLPAVSPRRFLDYYDEDEDDSPLNPCNLMKKPKQMALPKPKILSFDCNSDEESETSGTVRKETSESGDS